MGVIVDEFHLFLWTENTSVKGILSVLQLCLGACMEFFVLFMKDTIILCTCT